MTNSLTLRNLFRLLVLFAAVCALVALPLLSSAHSSTTVNIVNNSSRELRHVYLSHVNADDWGADQLNNATISPGQSFTLSDLACDAQQIKVIGEDQDGCFASTVISCGESATWTMTSDTARDCGGN
jgi:hypothetical protein